MVVLTDLPDELLLSIVAGVSPLYIESFALSCKRLHGLCAELIREHDRIRSEIPTNTNNNIRKVPFGAPTYKVLRCLLQNPSLAEYPLSWDTDTVPWPGDLAPEIDTHTLQGPHAYLFDTENSRPDAADLVIPLMITQLVNVRKIRMSIWQAPYLIGFMSRIIETSHDPIFSLQEPSVLGRLKEVYIHAIDHPCLSGTELALLLSMLPSLRKLHVFHLFREEPYVCSQKYHDSGVTDIFLDGKIDSESIVQLIQRTKSLQKFTYAHWFTDMKVKFEPRRLLSILKKCTRQSLIFLCLVNSRNLEAYPNCDLSLGSLRDFMVLKYLVTGVEMFIKTRGNSETQCGTGTVQRLVSWLPASLETLVLNGGLGVWNADILRMLFRGFRNQKQLRLPNLKRIKFLDFPMADQVMPHAIKVACRETGVAISYTLDMCANCHPYEYRHECLQDWEDHAWIDLLGDCCGSE